MPEPTVTLLEQIGRSVLDVGWYVVLGMIGAFGLMGRYFFNRVQNSVSREELKEHLEALEKRNTSRIEVCHRELKTETDYVKGRVDAIYTFLLRGHHAHGRKEDEKGE